MLFCLGHRFDSQLIAVTALQVAQVLDYRTAPSRADSLAQLTDNRRF